MHGFEGMRYVKFHVVIDAWEDFPAWISMYASLVIHRHVKIAMLLLFLLGGSGPAGAVPL